MALATIETRLSPSGPYRDQDVPDPPAGSSKKYTIGPAFSGAEYPTWQAAIDQAEIDGHGASFGGVEFDVYPGFYNESAVIPATILHWQVRGCNEDLGTYINALEVQCANGVGDWTISNIGVTTFTVTQAASGAGSINARLSRVWVYGAFNVVAPDLALQGTSCHFIGSASKSFEGNQVFWWECAWEQGGSANVAFDSNATRTRFVNCYVVGRIIAAGANFAFIHSQQYFAAPHAIEDSCSSFSDVHGNTWHLNGPNQSNIYLKSGASSLAESGNSYGDGCQSPFFQITGTGGSSGKIEADEVYSRTTLTLATGNPKISDVWPSTHPAGVLRGNGSGVLEWAPRDFENTKVSGCENTTSNTARVMPIYVPSAIRLNSFFTYFRALDTSINFEMGLYDPDTGNAIALTAATPIVQGIARAAAVAPVDLAAGFYLLAILGDGGGGGNIQVLRDQSVAAIIGADLGSAPTTLPASITVATNSLRFWGGVSERVVP